MFPDSPYLRGLNDEQRRAVLHDGGPLQIIAGAGTGKTRTLVHRVARLVATGTAPDRILLLTFTRRAAAEMVQRAATTVPGAGIERAWGGTFHAVANRLLRADGGPVGIDPSFTVLDQGDATELLSLLRTETSVAEQGRRFPTAATLMAVYSRVANTQASLSTTLDEHFPWCRDHAEEIGALFVAYAERKRRHHVLDYDDLLLWWRAALEHPASGPVMRRRFDHVLVDEYQDTNAVQADVLWSLTSEHGGVTVVGDDAQAIYSFRAATIANMAEFARRFDGATVLTLEQNYRSTPQILGAANAALLPGTEHHPKTLRAVRADGPRPRLTTCGDEATEARVVAERILEQRERGTRLREQAVLFRTAHHSDLLEVELQARDIPFVKFGGLRFLDAAHVKDVLALLRVLDNPRDELAWHRVLAMLPGVGPATVRRVTAALDLETGTGLERFGTGHIELPGVARAAAEELAAAWSDCAGSGPGAEPPPATQLERLLVAYTPLLPRLHDHAASRLADLDALCTLAAGHSCRSQFLADLTLDPPVSGSDLAGPPHLDDDWLTLSTIHSAKGGEWSVVHVIRVADGSIPSEMAMSDPHGLEEERRLLHVALTRARNDLELTWPLRFHHHHPRGSDRHSYGRLSRFLSPVVDRFDELGEPGPGGAGMPEDGDSPGPSVPTWPDPVGDLLGSLWRT